MCEKNGPDSPSGLARTARSARLRFCLFRRFVFIQGVCLSRRAQRAETVTHFYGHSFDLDNNPPNLSPFRQQWVAQRKSEVNEKNFCLKFVYISKAKVERFQPWLYFCAI